MVVEDEPDIYDVLLAMFEIWGIEGVAFVDGSEAVAWIDDVDAGRVRTGLPELAILDIRLPEVSGPEIAARLRKSPILGNIAIVLITAYHMPARQEAEVLKLSRADLLLYKPLPTMPELREAMDTVIEKRKSAESDTEAVASSESPQPETSSETPSAAEKPVVTPSAKATAKPAVTPEVTPGKAEASTPNSKPSEAAQPTPPQNSKNANGGKAE